MTDTEKANAIETTLTEAALDAYTKKPMTLARKCKIGFLVGFGAAVAGALIVAANNADKIEDTNK